MDATRQHDRKRSLGLRGSQGDGAGHNGTHNRLLNALPPAAYKRLAPLLTRVPLKLKQVIYEADSTITHVYFPVSGLVSMVNPMEEGAVEVGTVGNEGLVGLPLLHHADSMRSRAFVQVVGEAERIGAADFAAVLNDGEPTRRLFYRYAQAVFDEVAQLAACNRRHVLEERCARWLLMTHDRVGADRGVNQFPLTQEFLSYMLGVHRPAVTLAAGALQKAGIIEYHRGIITVLDREGLERASCSCYGITRRAFQKLLG